jgi:alkanesulfonate monooxygenase SsuD/methylene tetrahydromethanopterin reductase-like flavin-dependent oxidoreductase (luciferase family)
MSSSTRIELGILLWSQSSDWPTFMEAARRVDGLGYDHLWTWDHILPIFGAIDQPIFEGWTALSALAAGTIRSRVGLLVSANTFRNPALLAKMAVTADHISGGRVILGLGGAWFQPEHDAFGLDFGESVGARLDRLDEAAGLVRDLLDGKRVRHRGPAYRVDDLQLDPPAIQARVPLMIGGVGERKTLRTVAHYADMWNAFGPDEVLRHKAEVLRQRCEEVGRDPADITFSVACKPLIRDSQAAADAELERIMAVSRVPMEDIADDASFWVGEPARLAERMVALRSAGFDAFIGEMGAPYDAETMERWMGEVKPLVESA